MPFTLEQRHIVLAKGFCNSNNDDVSFYLPIHSTEQQLPNLSYLIIWSVRAFRAKGMGWTWMKDGRDRIRFGWNGMGY